MDGVHRIPRDVRNCKIKNLFWRKMTVLIFCFFGVLLLISVQDIRKRKIKDKYLVAIVFLALTAHVAGMGPSAPSRIAGALSVSALLVCITLLSPGAFGGGDIKLMAAAGLFLGFKTITHAFQAAIVLAGVFAAVRMILGKAGRKTELAMAPFLSIGMAAVIIWNESLSQMF